MIRLLLTVVLLATSAQAADAPPNILFIAADDLDHGSLGFNGSKLEGGSPNLDRLAAEGIVFSHAYVNIAVCIPSRAVWMTGRYPLHSGATGFGAIRSDVPTLPRVLARDRYLTGVIGKAKHYRKRASYAWDVRVESAQLEEGRSPDAYYEQTRRFLARAKTERRPFFLHVNTNDPHRPFAGSEQEPPTAAWISERSGRKFTYPTVVDPVSPAKVTIPAFLPDLPEVREEIAQYFSSVRRMDRSVGEVLRALDEAGAAADTIVVFSSDHGMSLPFGKSNCYRQSTRVPLVIRWPGRITAGSLDHDHVVAAVDVLPTLLELAGRTPLEGIDGRSFAAVALGGRLPGFERVFTSFHVTVNDVAYPMRGVQEARWGYVYNSWSDGDTVFVNESQMGLSFAAMQAAAETSPEISARVRHFQRRTPEELYDYERDPGALANLIHDPAERARVDAMRRALLAHMNEIGDPLAARFMRRVASPGAPPSSLRSASP